MILIDKVTGLNFSTYVLSPFLHMGITFPILKPGGFFLLFTASSSITDIYNGGRISLTSMVALRRNSGFYCSFEDIVNAMTTPPQLISLSYIFSIPLSCLVSKIQIFISINTLERYWGHDKKTPLGSYKKKTSVSGWKKRDYPNQLRHHYKQKHLQRNISRIKSQVKSRVWHDLITKEIRLNIDSNNSFNNLRKSYTITKIFVKSSQYNYTEWTKNTQIQISHLVHQQEESNHQNNQTKQHYLGGKQF